MAARGLVAGVLPVADKATLASLLLLSPSFGQNALDESLVAHFSKSTVAARAAVAASLAAFTFCDTASEGGGCSMSARGEAGVRAATALVASAASARI